MKGKVKDEYGRECEYIKFEDTDECILDIVTELDDSDEIRNSVIGRSALVAKVRGRGFIKVKSSKSIDGSIRNLHIGDYLVIDPVIPLYRTYKEDQFLRKYKGGNK